MESEKQLTCFHSLVAGPDIKWTAERVEKESMPKEWGEMRDGKLLLKDTRGSFWKNKLVSPNEFEYLFPRNPSREWEKDIVTRIFQSVREAYSDPNKALTVKLYSTPGSRDEYYGEWFAEKVSPSGARGMKLTMKRKRYQEKEQALFDEGKKHRSKNEAHHEKLLKEVYLRGWNVVHEPETILDIHEPSVVDGKERSVATGMTRSYTCDFVANKGWKRVCIESKPCRDLVTEESLSKCRILRDRTLTRVVMMVGGRVNVEWLDFGSSDDPKEEWTSELITE